MQTNKNKKEQRSFKMTDSEYNSLSSINKELADSTLSFLNYLSEIFETKEI